MRAVGEFEVNLQPLDTYATGIDGANFGRISIDKTFKGDLTAKSKGEMLSVMTAEEGSAGYVAIEQVSGELLGKKGSFVLQHFGTMTHGEDHLLLEVVPNSGAEELAGLVGKMSIKIESSKHYYELDYEFSG